VLGDALAFDQQGVHIGNEITLAGWRRADGYAGLEPQRKLDYRSLSVLRTAGVGWVRQGGAAGNVDGLLPHDPQWREVPRPLPRVRLVGRAEVSANPAADIQSICVDTTALSEVPLVFPAGPSTAAPGAAVLDVERPGRMEISVHCPAPQLLVVAESYHAGWQCTVDGSPQTVLRINGDFMGLPIPAGDHQVQFEFHPRSLWFGRIDSCLGLGLLGLGLVAGLRRPASRVPEDAAQ
jgi:hypothetical protein